MMKYKALEIDDSIGKEVFFNTFLLEAYETSLLIKSNEFILTIISQRRDLLPKSVRVSNEVFHHLRKELSYENPIDITLCPIEKVSLSIEGLSKDLGQAIEESRRVVGFYKNEQEEYYKSLEKKVWDFITEVKSGKVVNSYLGYGIGATPSMDDIIFGGMIMLYISGQKHVYSIIEKYVKENMDKTTQTSIYQFTNFFEEKLIPKVLKELIRKQTFQSTLKCLKHGHTSGLDVLYGMIIFHENFCDIGVVK
ncbi:oxamate carbamoyltransferase subunit AllH family protein [Granulicatella adiacens]|uniref:oxamate carbamoyltransferase subunit AllH family protein n=1 Tax=Granulicatella adiacens TaxID=46124 RepID=UPI004024B515